MVASGGVPQGLPLTVNPRSRRILIPFGVLLAVGMVPYLLFCGVLVLSLRGPAESRVVLVLLLALIGLLPVGEVGLLAFVWWRVLVYRGPFLSADTQGVWVRAKPWSAQAVWLPWAGIRVIEQRGRWIGRNIRILPTDCRTEYGFMLLGADLPGAQILHDLSRLSAGRVPVLTR
jgi:hypothetical protein